MPPETQLTPLLERLLGPVTRIEARPHPERSSFPLRLLRVSLEDGSQLELVLKDLRWSTLSATSRRAKPDFLHDPTREIETYRQVLSTGSYGTAVFYGADESCLVIEHVDGPPLWQVGELAVWCAAAHSIAELHRDLANQVLNPSLLRYDADFYRLWLERAETFTGPLPSVANCHEDVVQRLLSLPETVIHGEYYASNIVIAEKRVCPVDWELAAAGPGLFDLAALATGWADTDQAAIIAAYGDVDEDDLDCCRLQLALRWLGWSQAWTPPTAHARDWRAEALGAARRLGTTRRRT